MSMSLKFALCPATLLVSLVVPAAIAQVVPDGTAQPVEARAAQLADFPLQIAKVESLGIIPDSQSKRFWFDVLPGVVGPVTIERVNSGSPAVLAGFLAGDVILEIRKIPHYQRPNTFQSLTIEGGAVELGKNINRALSFGFTKITLRVRRVSTLIDLVLPIS